MFPDIIENIQSFEKSFDAIPPNRRNDLNLLSDYFIKRRASSLGIKIIVICTHNSRRSHMAQLWLAAAAEHYKISDFQTYSGGTEATAFNPNAVGAMRKAGFDIEGNESLPNPVYGVRWKAIQSSYKAFSTKYDDPFNPQSDFVAMMVCQSADEACPIVRGMDFRITIEYNDPKAFDNTDLQDAKYSERCLEIGREMCYVMQRVSIESNCS